MIFLLSLKFFESITLPVWLSPKYTQRDIQKEKEIPEMVRMYQTGRMITPETEKRTKVEVLVPDSVADSIVQELIKSIGSESEPGGLVFVTDVSNAHLLGTSRSGESLLIKE